MEPLVHICISDSGWILETMAKEIARRLNYVSYSQSVNPQAQLQYYLTYGTRSSRVSPIEIACFTHQEEEMNARRKFLTTAAEVDHCICISQIYRDVINSWCDTPVSVISTGVDLNHYKPKLRLGVVGRTYHTGRKGEHIVAELMQEDWLEFHFTGSGWPGPARNLSYHAMPDFYRSLDYVIVPSLIEGGPLCVLEAMACGVPVIAPPVGHVPEISGIIPYETGNVEDLRRVLGECFQKKLALRDEIADRTWENWARKHEDLFNRLLGEQTIKGFQEIYTVQDARLESVTPSSEESLLYVDVTLSSLKANEPATGMSRVEQEIAKRLPSIYPGEITFVSYNQATSGYVTVPHERLIELYRGDTDQNPFFSEDYEPAIYPPRNEKSTLLVLGHGWYGNIALTRTVLDFSIKSSSRLVFLVPDLIPVKYPQWFNNIDYYRIRRQLLLMLEFANSCLCFSRKTASDLRDFAQAEGFNAPPQHLITLGETFDPETPLGDLSREQAYKLDGRPYALYVSSIGLRKNHQSLIVIWERLVKEYGSRAPLLVFTGAVTREMKEEVNRWKRNPALSEHLVFLNDITDSQLLTLYRNCLFTLFPSLYEGWGLPVAESLALGKIVIASDAGAVPEIAPGITDLVDPFDLPTWYDSIVRYSFDEERRTAREHEIATGYALRSWDQTAQSVVAGLQGSPGSDNSDNNGLAAIPGRELAANCHAPALFVSGWHKPEEWGTWSRQGPAILRCYLAGFRETSYQLTARLRPFLHPDFQNNEMYVLCNNKIIDRWKFYGNSIKPATRTAEIPPDFLGRSALTEITFYSVNGCSPASVGMNDDKRKLATGLEAIQFDRAEDDKNSKSIQRRNKTLFYDNSLLFKNGRSAHCLGDGWGNPANWGVWSEEDSPTLSFYLWPVIDDSVTLQFTMRAFVWRANPLITAEVHCNGRFITKWKFSSEGDRRQCERELKLRRGDFDESGHISIAFKISGAISASELGLSDDDRRLGIGLFEVTAQTDNQVIADLLESTIGT